MVLRDLLRSLDPSHSPQDDEIEPVENKTMFQGFEWYCPADGLHWRRLQDAIAKLKAIGISSIWIPPGCKAGNQNGNGYDIYDLYDLGEFDQKGSRRTKWGPKEDLLSMMTIAHSCEMQIYWDAVLNHKSAADYTENCLAVKVSKTNRNKEIGEAHQVEVWTGYNFPGRGGRYSTMEYHWHHFSGTDWEARLKTNEYLYRFVGSGKPGWAMDVDGGFGNYDFLMGNDLDYSQKEVRDDALRWGVWIVREVGLSGFRLDAVKHFSHDFLKVWIEHLDSVLGRKLFMVGEYWRGELDVLGPMIERFDGRLSLFDVALATNISHISMNPNSDLRQILYGTLAKHYPNSAVTFVQNHDTQERFERDHLVTPIEAWFIPHAYAFILLRAQCGHPCVFYGDLYGVQGNIPKPPSCNGQLPKLIYARALYAYGKMGDYLDERDCIGFTRLGHPGRGGGAGLAVILSNAASQRMKRMYVGDQHAGEDWTDILGLSRRAVSIDKKGYGEFSVEARSVGVWINKNARHREELDHLDFDINIYQHPIPATCAET